MVTYEKKEYKNYNEKMCKVCGFNIHKNLWKAHVEIEKKRFCKEMGLDEKYWFEVKWKNVIKKLNPEMYRAYYKKEVQLDLNGRKLLR